MDFIDGAVLFEQILKIVLGGLKREITYVQFHCVLNWKNYRATEPFPGIGFQTTNERRSPDDLPRSEVKQSNPISAHYRPDRSKHKRSFPTPQLAGMKSVTGCECQTFQAPTYPPTSPDEVDRLPVGGRRITGCPMSRLSSLCRRSSSPHLSSASQRHCSVRLSNLSISLSRFIRSRSSAIFRCES